tara:strand:- start:393 stop:2003 length:1611 start_codon:yes stop_codon:yes gene_type:complete
MFFNSLAYLVFLPVVYGLYRLLGRRGQNLLLLGASYYFYGCWDVRFLFLIALSTGIDYYCGLMLGEGLVSRTRRRGIGAWFACTAIAFAGLQWQPAAPGQLLPQVSLPTEAGWWIIVGSVGLWSLLELTHSWFASMEERRRRRWFVRISVIGNLTILGFFKYFNFFVESAEGLATACGLPAEWLRLDLVLPVGISFYTFQTMSYTLDIARNKLKPTRSFLDFSLFVAFFPQLVAGPIERASHLLPILARPRALTFEGTTRGMFLILLGLMKKVAIADGVAESVNSIYLTGGAISWLDLVAATFLFAIQIYCDFSGYSDIARGTSKLLGIDLMTNFRCPYLSVNPQEFWQRWHISLSSWLRDYLYIPLGGNRGSTWLTNRNLLLTMVLGGLWHGAAWNFVLWGLYQGGLLVIHRSLGHHGPIVGVMRRLIGAAMFFPLVCYGWLLFRAESMEQIADFTQILFTDFGNMALTMSRPTLAGILGISLLIAVELLEFRRRSPRFYLAYPRIIRGSLYAGMFLAIVMGTSNDPAQFIYFQF